MELNQFKYSAFCLKVRMVLDAKNFSYKTTEIKPVIGQLEIFRISGQKQVPVLVDGPNWEDAQENAEELGGHLVTVNDEDENQWLVDKFSLADRETSTWIGLKINNEGDWEWASGQDSSYRGWDDVEPNNSDYQGRSEEFGAIRGSGKWNDLHNTRLADAGTGQGIAEVPICD